MGRPDTLAAEFTSLSARSAGGPLAAEEGSVCSRDPELVAVSKASLASHGKAGGEANQLLCPGESRAIHGYYATESQGVAIYQGIRLCK